MRQLWSSVGDMSKWQQGGNWTGVANAGPSNESQLAATGYYCGSDCLDAMCIVFQGNDNVVYCGCSEGWDSPAVVTPAYPNSPLAFMPLAANYGANITYDNMLVLLFLDNTDINVLSYNSQDDGVWDSSKSMIMAFFLVKRMLTIDGRSSNRNSFTSPI